MAQGFAVEVRAATKVFGRGGERVVALDGVSAGIRANEFFTLLGPSGCGKTTLLRLIAGFEQPDGGEILLDGEAITRLPPFKRPVNTVFQSYALFPHLSVAENVGFGLSMRKRPKAEIEAAVAEMLALAMIGVFMLVPIGIIAVYSLLEADPCGGVEPRFSAEAYVQFFFERDLDGSLVFNPAYLAIFGRSILLAAAAMLLSLLIGFPVACYRATQPAARRNLLVLLVTIPFWTNLLPGSSMLKSVNHVSEHLSNMSPVHTVMEGGYAVEEIGVNAVGVLQGFEGAG